MERRVFLQDEIENIIHMYDNGCTQQTIADKYNTTQGTISSVIKRCNPNYTFRNGKTVSKAEYDNIVDLYNNKLTQLEIADLYNCSPSLISFILKQKGVNTRLGGSLNTQEDICKWVQMYNDGMLIKDIAEQYNVSRVTVSKLLKKNGVNIDRYRYHFNEHYFDNIDSQEKAYLLGLLWSDGHNCLSKNYVTLSLQDSDKDILEQINNLTENERPLRKNELSKKNPKYHDQYILTWGSKYFAERLNSLGMYPNKTLIAEYPCCIDEDLHSHFCRGYLDGDGCISLLYEGKFAHIGLVGTSMLLNSIKDIVKKQIGVDVFVKRDERARDPICNLRCDRKNDALKLLEWIYKDANIYFQRKYNKYQQFLLNNTNINNSYLN